MHDLAIGNLKVERYYTCLIVSPCVVNYYNLKGFSWIDTAEKMSISVTSIERVFAY